jgi:hypothetical protein
MERTYMYLMTQGGVRCYSDGGDGREKPVFLVFVSDVISTVVGIVVLGFSI